MNDEEYILQYFKNLNQDIINMHPNSHIRRKYLREIIGLDFVKECVINRKMSIHSIDECLKKINVKTVIIRSLCEENNISTPTIKESANNKKVKEKRENFCMHKYGGKNVLSKNTVLYEKRNVTVKEKYGVDNVFQLDSVKEKSKETMLKNWGVPYGIFLPQHKVHNQRSGPHKKVEDFLTSKNIIFESEVKNLCLTNKEEYNPMVDILIKDKNIIIEIYGDHWHANPKKYNENDIIKKYKAYLKAKEIWDLDKKRIQLIESFGYKVIILWESEINKNDFEKINFLI